MSVQIALMAGMVAMSAASAASQASKAAGAAGAAKDQGVLGDLIKKSQGMAAAAGTGVEIAETKLATVQQEIARRRQIAQLWQSNAIDAVGRGAAPGGGTDLVAAAQDYNARLGAEDIANIQFMGESRVSKLSFRKTQLELGASMTDLDAMNISANAERRASDAQTAMIFQIGSAALKGASSFTYSGGGGSGFDMAQEAKVTGGAGAYGLGPGG